MRKLDFCTCKLINLTHMVICIFSSVIKGQGELDRQDYHNSSQTTESRALDGCPYLLLDIRDKDAFDQCHIITGTI